MKDKDLYRKLSKRDYSNSLQDEYAQSLQAYWYHCVLSGQEKAFYKLLEKANNENKQLSLSNPFTDEISFRDIIISEKRED